jgi:bacterioferritin
MTQAGKKERRQKVIEVLNKARTMELQAISQYMNQHYNLDDMDYGELAGKLS